MVRRPLSEPHTLHIAALPMVKSDPKLCKKQHYTLHQYLDLSYSALAVSFPVITNHWTSNRSTGDWFHLALHLALWVCINLSLQVVPRSPFNYQHQSFYPANAKSPKLSCLSFSSGPKHNLLCALSDPCPASSVRICVPFWRRPLGSCLLFFSSLVSLPAWLCDWQLRPLTCLPLLYQAKYPPCPGSRAGLFLTPPGSGRQSKAQQRAILLGKSQLGNLSFSSWGPGMCIHRDNWSQKVLTGARGC